MTDTDIREALVRATDDLQPRPGLLDDVRRGGHGRVVRRRSLLGGGLAAAAAGAAGTAWWPRSGAVEPTGSWLLDDPTRGDLADDARYLRQVREAWQHLHGNEGDQSVLVGEPHVVWAGSTPAGPAAFVAQRYTDPEARVSLTVAFIEPTASGPKPTGPANYTPGDPSSVCPRAVLLGAARNVLLVLDTDEPVRWSPRLSYAPDGRVLRDYRPVVFSDGAAALRVPPQGPQISIGLQSGTPAAPKRVDIVNAVELEIASRGSAGGGAVLSRDLPDPRRVWPADPTAAHTAADSWVAEPLLPYLDIGGHQNRGAGPAWKIRGTTPDGRRFAVRTLSAYDGRQRILVVLGREGSTAQVVYGGIVKGAFLPIAVRLPDEQGVVVAGEDVTLRYRTAEGKWLPAKGDAALLPDAAAWVQASQDDLKGSFNLP